MENLDLNIDNYNLKDILNLFKLNYDFDENGLKQAKKRVMQTHPDKSGLSSDFFIFFGKAYKILHYIYNFKRKSNNNTLFSYNELLSHTENENNIIDKIKKNKNFNTIFNEIFEDVKIKNEFTDKGYGEWLNNPHESMCDNKVYTKQEMHKFINKKRKDMVQIYNNESINNISSTSHFTLTQDAPKNYQSDIFSNLQYEDVKKAYSESIIPVNDENINKSYKSVQQLKQIRHNQNIKPHTQQESNKILNLQENKNNLINMNRAYVLAKQNDLALKAQKEAMARFYSLTN